MDTLEKGAYIMLMLAHYQSGHAGIPNDDVKLARIAGVSPSVWKRIKPILMEKFEISGEFLVSEKCQKVLSGVEEKSLAQRTKALKRHGRGDATAQPQQCQPKPKPNISSKEEDIRPADVSESVWKDYLKTRKAKKAGLPTHTGIAGIRREAEGIGWTLEQALRKCAERSWVGFEAKWITGEQNEINRGNSRKPNTKSTDEYLADAIADIQREFEGGPTGAGGDSPDRHTLLENDGPLRA